MRGWITVEGKVNRRPKNKPRHVDSDENDETSLNKYQNYHNSISTNNNNNTSNNNNNNKKNGKGNNNNNNNNNITMEAAKAELKQEETKRQENELRKKKSEINNKQKLAHEEILQRSDTSKWPTITTVLKNISNDLHNYFNNLVTDDPIVSPGGIRALLLYVPGVFEKYIGKHIIIPESVIIGQRTLYEEIIHEDREAAGVCEIYKNIINNVVISKEESDDDVADAMEALLVTVYGSKGGKEVISLNNNNNNNLNNNGNIINTSLPLSGGVGTVLAVELTISQFARVFLSNINRMLAIFHNNNVIETNINNSKGSHGGDSRPHGGNIINNDQQQQYSSCRFNSPIAKRNFINILRVAFSSSDSFETEGDEQGALARAVVNMFILGVLPSLFDHTNITNTNITNTNIVMQHDKEPTSTNASACEYKSGINLIRKFVYCLRYVSNNKGGTSPQKVYTSLLPPIPWRKGVSSVPCMLASPHITNKQITNKCELNGNIWLELCLELLTRDYCGAFIIKANVIPLLGVLEGEISDEAAAKGTFTLSHSSALVLLLSCINSPQYGASHVVPCWRDMANRNPMASKVLLQFMEMQYKGQVNAVSSHINVIRRAITEGIKDNNNSVIFPKLIYDKSVISEIISLVAGIRNTEEEEEEEYNNERKHKGNGIKGSSSIQSKRQGSGSYKENTSRNAEIDKTNHTGCDSSNNNNKKSLPNIITRAVIFMGLLGAAAGILVAHGDIKLFEK